MSKDEQTVEEVKKVKSPKFKHLLTKKNVALLAIPVAILVLAFLPNLVSRALNMSKNMPNTSIAGVNVSGKNQQQTEEVLKDSYNNKKVTFNFNGQKETASYEEVGIQYDYQNSFYQSLKSHRDNLADIVFFWRNVDIEPQYSINQDRLNQYIISKYGQSEPAKNAEIVFSEDQSQFIINPEKDGFGVSANRASQEISSISRSEEDPSIDLVEETVKPNISTKNLESLNNQANEAIKPEMVIAWSGTSQTVQPVVKKDWIKLKDDQDKYLSEIQADPEAPKNYINDLISQISKDAITEEVISAPGNKIIITKGQDGLQVVNPERYATQFSEAFTSNQPLNLSLETKSVPRPVKDYAADGGRWLYSDLSEFKMIAYEGSNPVRTFAISSGISRFPTVTGNFKVYAKVRSQTMKGGSGTPEDPIYEVPNVEWISYFHGDYGIHGVYWHNNFGVKNGSHGCIGITNADAQWIYNWDSIGTPVIVRP